VIEGVLNIDKPDGITSHDVIYQIRRVAGLRRVGHAGTLDPLATGVLLVCLGRATRLVEYLVGQPKTYEAAIRLGQSTNTYDAEGDVVAERPLTFTPTDVTHALAQFRGDIEQVPPMYSAIKKDGQPLYKLARRGEKVELEPRPVTIYELDMLAFEPPILKLRVTCSSGTYIRSLAHDLGEVLGCGGHITALRRTAVGNFSLDTAVPLAHLTPENVNTYLLPMDTAVTHLPRIQVTQASAAKLWQGQIIRRQPDQPDADLVRAYTNDGDFIGLVQAERQAWRPRKMFPPA